jgi:hypothetical protein
MSSSECNKVGMRGSHSSECYDSVIWVATLHSQVDRYCFRRIYCLYAENACSSFHGNTGNEQPDFTVLNFRKLCSCQENHLEQHSKGTWEMDSLG